MVRLHKPCNQRPPLWTVDPDVLCPCGTPCTDDGYVLLDVDYPKHLHKINDLIQKAKDNGMEIIWRYCAVCEEVIFERPILINKIVGKYL